VPTAAVPFSALPEPILANSGRLPTRGSWSYEVKCDGFQAIVSTEGPLRVRRRLSSEAATPQARARLSRRGACNQSRAAGGLAAANIVGRRARESRRLRGAPAAIRCELFVAKLPLHTLRAVERELLRLVVSQRYMVARTFDKRRSSCTQLSSGSR
jgi:hypothetical protein